jgi:hypothetical protein
MYVVRQRGIYSTLKGGMRPHITLIGDGTDALERVSTSFHLLTLLLTYSDSEQSVGG